MQAPKQRILAIPGSLRSGSSNHQILRFLGKIISPDMTYTIYDGLAQIPPFDPDNDHEPAPAAVNEFRNLILHADGVILCTPEYAFGVPGQLKNALDWTVSSGSFSRKPTALITASTGGENAHEAMQKTLGALDAHLVTGGALLISFIRSKVDQNGHITHQETADSLTTVLNALLHVVTS